VILSCEWLEMKLVERVAYFPIVVICLTAEGFARTLLKEGWGSALWRGGMTALVAVLIALLSGISLVSELLAAFPELLLAHVGVIILIAEFFDWRLLERFNPSARKRKGNKSTRSTVTDAARADSLEEAAEQTQTL